MVYPSRNIGVLRAIDAIDLTLGPNRRGVVTDARAAVFTEDGLYCIAVMERHGQAGTAVTHGWPETAERCRDALVPEMSLEDLHFYAVFPAGDPFVFARPEVKHFFGAWDLPSREAASRWCLVGEPTLRPFILGLFPRSFYGSNPPNLGCR